MKGLLARGTEPGVTDANRHQNMPCLLKPKFVEDEFECACGICRSANEDMFFEKNLIRKHIRGQLEWLADYQEAWA